MTVSVNRTDSYYAYFVYGSDPLTPGGALETGKILTTDGVNTTYATTSDYRLKTVLGAIPDVVGKLKQLKPIQFKWKSNDALPPNDGFLAHEVQAIFPHAVSGEKDDVDQHGAVRPQAMDTSFLIPLLTAALQNALSRIEALEAKVGV